MMRLLISAHWHLGEPGNLTFLPTAQLPSRSPSLFAVSRNQLFQYRNESTVYPVAVENTTLVDGVPPLQLVLGKYNNGLVSGGNWHWKGTMLRYELGSNGNQGIFYTCPTEGGSSGIFMSLSPFSDILHFVSNGSDAGTEGQLPRVVIS